MKGKFKYISNYLRTVIGVARKKLYFVRSWGVLSPFDIYIITALCELNMNFRGFFKIF